MNVPHPVVLVHGFTGSAGSWGEDLVRALAAGGRRVACMHLPGHHPDPGCALAPARFLDEALERIARTGGEEPFHLLGYSMGGRIALHFALRHPGRLVSLTLESASPGLEDPAARAARRAEDEALAEALEREGLEAFVRSWERRPLFRGAVPVPEATRARMALVRRSHRAEGLAAALRGLGTGVLPSLWALLPGIRVPTLLLAGALDEKFVALAGRMADALPDRTVRIADGAAHTVHVDCPDLWLEAVLGHLRSVEARGRGAGPS